MAIHNRAAPEHAAPKHEATFPLWVKRWRAYLDVTQKRFAELWGVSLSMVQKIEANDYEVGQLSFDRLESLRALLQLDAALFYGILSGADPAQETSSNVTLLSDDFVTPLGSVAVPSTLLNKYAAEHLHALSVTPATFATDRLRYAVTVGSLLIVANTDPTPTDRVVGSKRLRGDAHLLVCSYPSEDAPQFLRPFAPDDERSLELTSLSDFDQLLGVYVGHWTSWTHH